MIIALGDVYLLLLKKGGIPLNFEKILTVLVVISYLVLVFYGINTKEMEFLITFVVGAWFGQANHKPTKVNTNDKTD